MAIVWVRGEHQGVDESAVAYHVTINGDIYFFSFKDWLKNMGAQKKKDRHIAQNRIFI
jgi:hypothetical protein